MKVNGINLYCRNSNNMMPNISFERRLRHEEEKDYNENAIKAALDYLGVQSVAMILHGPCNPVTQYDLGVGSPCNEKAKEVIKFEKLHGFNSNQLGPMGEVTKGDISPYSATVFAINRMFIDPVALTSDEYANILSKADLSALSEDYSEDKRPFTYSKFFDSFENYDRILKLSYSNFKQKVAEGDEKALELQSEYKAFRDRKRSKLEYAALFEVLSNKYGTRDVSVWENQIDRNLPELLRKRDMHAIRRYRQLVAQHSEDLNSYIFGQFIVNKQMKANKDFRDSIGFEYINDNLVGNDSSEEWMYPEVFLKDYRLGCPEGGVDGQQQTWDIPVIDPKKLFNSDGSLGPAGKFLKDKLESALEYCENIRIDHALGLVDPYIYDKNSVVYVDSVHIDRSRFRGSNMSYREDIDPNHDYEKILEKIVLPVLKEHGINPEDAVWEDLGNNTDKFNEIYFNRLNLPRMKQLYWSRGEGSSDKDWILVGSHDEASAIEYINEVKSYWNNNDSPWQPEYLAGYLNQDPARIDDRNKFQQKLYDNPEERVKAKFAEMLVSGKKVQISFADFFGIPERYNAKGTKSYKNWKLRLNSNYQDDYYKNLSSDNPTALNMPEVLKIAVQARKDMNIMSHVYDIYGKNGLPVDESEVANYRAELNKKVDPILEKLEHYENVLKEKE